MFREECRLQPWNLMHRVSCRCLLSTDEGLRMGREMFLLAACECQWGICGFGAFLSNTHSMGKAGVGGCGT